jgi:hypothetical protein
MGKKRGKSRKGSKAERDSEEEESTTSQMSGTSSEKRRLAETREELQEANLEALRLAAGAAVASKRSTWKPGSAPFTRCPLTLLLSPSPRTFCSFGNTHSIGLDFIPLCSAWARRNARCSRQELANHEKNQQEFRTTYTTPSYHQLQHDVYSALERLLGKSIKVSNLFN